MTFPGMVPGPMPARKIASKADAEAREQERASALFLKLSKLPRPMSDPYVLRARGQEVGTTVFTVLSAGQLAGALASAHRETEKLLGADAKSFVAYEEVFQELRACHVLALGCRQPESPEFPTFPGGWQTIRDELTDDEIAVLLEAYGSFRRETGPMLQEMTPEECEAMIELLAKGASRLPLSRYTGGALADLVMYLVSTRVTGSSTATSSSGSPAAESSTPTTEGDPPPTP